MFKKYILLLLAVCLLLCGCNRQEQPAQRADQSAKNPADQSTKKPAAQLPALPDDPLAAIVLGMTPEQFLAEMEKANIAIQMPDYAQDPLPDDALNAKPDGRIYNIADYSFFYEPKDYRLYIQFSEEGLLDLISCHDSHFPTREGLKVGDSTDTVDALYGTPYDGEIADQYLTENGYLRVVYEDNILSCWILSDVSYYHNN